MRRRPAAAFRLRGLLFALSFASLPVVSRAHDLWLVAGRYTLEPRETTRVFINNGDAFPASVTLLGEHRIVALEVHGPSETVPVSDFRVDGKSLSFELATTSPGSHVLALETRSRKVRLKARDFEDYLEENRLDYVRELREELGESEDAAVERYVKWAKAFIDAPPAESDGASAWSRRVGHRLELVPERNPSDVRPGQQLAFELLYDGEPLEGALVSGGKAGGPTGELRTSTDAHGRAAVTIPSPGRFYLRAIHMVRVDGDPEVSWESFWCTVTFEVVGSP